jgi:HD-GYP domain-containing protein (c-di-GMP phosphodiesterase class II)
LRFSEAIAEGIHALDEHWDGHGRPEGLAGGAIPLYARIALLSQVIDVVNSAQGEEGVIAEVKARSGIWFDPELVAAFSAVAAEKSFWITLNSSDVESTILHLEPAQYNKPLDEDFLDDIAEAFGQVVDAKSPFTSGHSARVGLYASLLSEDLGLPELRRRWLKRGALLHDVGKLGVSNSILDKPGKLDDSEWAVMHKHATYTQIILGRIDVFEELARVSSAHHERLDGLGYPLGLKADQICLETRIITTADIFDAITAERPYRGAVPVTKTLDIMRETVGTALDPLCFESLLHMVKNHPELFPE